jgi:hypothetical protein
MASPEFRLYPGQPFANLPAQNPKYPTEEQLLQFWMRTFTQHMQDPETLNIQVRSFIQCCQNRLRVDRYAPRNALGALAEMSRRLLDPDGCDTAMARWVGDRIINSCIDPLRQRFEHHEKQQHQLMTVLAIRSLSALPQNQAGDVSNW